MCTETLVFRVVKEYFEQLLKDGYSIPEARHHLEAVVNGSIDSVKGDIHFHMVGLKVGNKYDNKGGF